MNTQGEKVMTVATTFKTSKEKLEPILEYHEWYVGEVQIGIEEADAGEFASNEEVEAVFEKYKRL
jgi:predicted transcriptional regulator